MQAILRTKTLKYWGLFLALLLVCLTLVGCAPASVHRPTPVQAGQNPIRVRFEQDFMTPTAWRVNADQEISIQIENTSTQMHTWALLEDIYGDPFSPENHSPATLVEFTTRPGEEISATFTAPTAPGEYSVICTQPGHTDRGEIGIMLVVQP